jgi:hypothetical protein
VTLVLDRLVVHLASTLAAVAMRRVVLNSPAWQALVRRDNELDEQLRRSVR